MAGPPVGGEVITPSLLPLPETRSLAERLAPFVSGPWIEAICGTTEDIMAEAFGPLAVEFIAALDTRDPVWRDGRPLWHLTVLEREAQVVPVVDASPADRYRAVRLADVSRWSEGLWSDLLRLAAAWLNAETVSPNLVRIYAWPLVVVYLFHPSVVPTGTNLEIFRAEVIATIQDVAGYALVEGTPGLVLSFDLPDQGFDYGLWGDTFDQTGDL